MILRGGVMVTYGCRFARLQVRFLALHPVVFVLALMLLAGSVGAADADSDAYYNARPVTAAEQMGLFAGIDNSHGNGLHPGSNRIFDFEINVQNGLVYRFEGSIVPEEARYALTVAFTVFDRINYYMDQLLPEVEELGTRVDALEANSMSEQVLEQLVKMGDYMSSTSWSYDLYYVDPSTGAISSFSRGPGSGLFKLLVDGFWSSAFSGAYNSKFLGNQIVSLGPKIDSVGAKVDSLQSYIQSFFADSVWTFNMSFIDPSTGIRTSSTRGSSGLFSLLSDGFWALSYGNSLNSQFLGDRVKDLQSFFSDSSWTYDMYYVDPSTGNITSISRGPNVGLFKLLVDGFWSSAYSGTLNAQFLGRSLIGTDRNTAFTFISIDADGNVTASTQDANNLLDALGIIGTSLQGPLAKLQYVLASDEDIAFKAAEKENLDTAQDSFFGDGAGAVKPSNITDVAGVSGGITSTFAGAGSPSDIFTAGNSNENWNWFSQSVADELNGESVSLQSDDDLDGLLDGFVLDEDGFYHLADTSFWEW